MEDRLKVPNLNSKKNILVSLNLQWKQHKDTIFSRFFGLFLCIPKISPKSLNQINKKTKSERLILIKHTYVNLWLSSMRSNHLSKIGPPYQRTLWGLHSRRHHSKDLLQEC